MLKEAQLGFLVPQNPLHCLLMRDHKLELKHNLKDLEYSIASFTCQTHIQISKFHSSGYRYSQFLPFQKVLLILVFSLTMAQT